jgi:hypothetical protein
MIHLQGEHDYLLQMLYIFEVWILTHYEFYMVSML